MLIVSQFTLWADCRSRRPGFTRAARPDGSPGRRIVRIYRADLEAWIKSKEATNAV